MTNLKRIIDEKGVQQRWLAEQVGVTEASMSRYVNGERIPRVPIAIGMADVLGVDVKELYGWDDKHVVGEPEQPETHSVCLDTISRQAAIDAVHANYDEIRDFKSTGRTVADSIEDIINALPSAEPEQRYTEDELRVFQRGISLSLLSKRSSQHWQYDEDTATEIEFLEQLYEKVGADMRGEKE